MNPFIYAFVSSRFRREFRRALGCGDAGLAAWSMGAAVGGSSAAANQRQHFQQQRDAGAPQVTSLRLHSVIVATTTGPGRTADARPPSMTVLGRNSPRMERQDDDIVAR